MNDILPSRTVESLDIHHPSRGLPARRTLDNLAWALGALALGWLAQGLFAREQLLEGLLLYAVAIPLFAVRLARVARREQEETRGQGTTLQSQTGFRVASGIRGRVGMGLAAVALILSFASLRLFVLERRNAASWSMYVGSLLLFVAGIWLAEPGVRGQGSRDQEIRDREAGNQMQAFPARLIRRFRHSPIFSSPDPLFLAILLLALFFRLFHFFSLPFGTWFDEAEAGIQARRILQDPAFRPVFWEPINLAAHLLYLFAFSFRLFGVSTPALRVISVLFGVGGVFFAYLFGREWKGRRWGLLLAFLVATMRWHMNFSRIAMTGIDTPFFEFATLYFAMRALRSGRLRPIAWTGLWLGLGLCFYGAFRFFVAALILFAIWVLAARDWRPSSLSPQSSVSSDLQSLISRLVLLLVAIWLAVMPVVQFAWQHRDVFWRRTRTVSIFENRDEPNLGRALAQNTQKHLLMFNYKGDNNGRHNLPGAPTLDRLSAVLFAMGLGLAVIRSGNWGVRGSGDQGIRGSGNRGVRESGDWEIGKLGDQGIGGLGDQGICRFFLLLFLFGLGGGIFTLDFEAPQSLRSMAALPAVVYFIALSLDALWLELKWVARVTQPRYSLIPVALGLGIITIGNGVTYFGRQAHDFAVWQAFSTAETLVGKRMAELGPDPIYYISSLFIDHPSIHFHAPVEESPRSQRKVMPLPDPLPARELPERPVVYFIHPDESWVFDVARQIYLSGWFETKPADSDFPPLVFVVQLEPGEVASVQGLDVRYWAGDDWEGEGVPVATGRSPVIDVIWPDDAPLDPPFVAEWNGVLYAPEYGRYALAVDAPGRVALTLDGEAIEGTGGLSLTPTLAQGNHSLRLRVAGGEGRVQLSWQSPMGDTGGVPQWALYSFPVSGHGLLGKYYPNPDWEGEPAMERVDPVLDVYFHLTPLPRPYSVEWTGALDVPYAGVYALGLRSVDEARLYLDDQFVVEATTPNEYVEDFLTLEAGLHDLRITYQDQTNRSRIHLYWARPNGGKEIIPTQYLWPGRASAQASPPLATPPPAAGGVPSGISPRQEMELTWQATWGGPGDAEGQFLEPRDVAVMGDTVFVADTGNRRVQAFDRTGAFRKAWSGGEEPFEEPLALGVDSQNRLLVLDSLPGWIYCFPVGDLQDDASGKPLDRSLRGTRFAGPSSQTFHPRGMTILPDDTAIVADTGGGRLVFFGPAGNMAGKLGVLGGAPGQLSEPTDVAVDWTETYYVSEASNQRIQRLDRWGNSLGEWLIPPSVAYDGPHLAWAPDGSLLVTAPVDGAILRYSPDGQLLNRWTQAGAAPLRQPAGIYVDAPTDTLYVTDTATHQVHVFKIE